PRKTDSALSAVAGDGIELRARARVTVRTNLAQLIGGATEETVIARVGQGIVSAIGSTTSYKIVLENPDMISRTVLDLGLEAQTAFEIVSIDIADIDVGDNIGARLQADQAEADVRVAQARAEQRRAEFAAKEQEMIAEIQANRAKVVLAEANVPKAIAEAIRSGKMGIMDYYELNNVQADTRMRAAIAADGNPMSNANSG
ncbi:MAG: flotillin-like FloA family protein, partial [Planctomycetaceae bacterium]|nr:flotillin-like FloA family protein [Planctomycetaceae bacterium]